MVVGGILGGGVVYAQLTLQRHGLILPIFAALRSGGLPATQYKFLQLPSGDRGADMVHCGVILGRG